LTVIRGDSTVLRDLRREDLRRYRWWWEEEIEWQKWDAPWETETRGDAAESLRKLQRVLDEGDLPAPRRRLEIETGSGRHVGWVGRYWVDSAAAGWWEVGINLPERSARGCGLGTEALALWVDYLFSELDIVRLGMGTWSGNHAMRRVADKLGFTAEARFRRARPVRGCLYDALRWGMLRDQWRTLRAGWPGVSATPGAGCDPTEGRT